MQTIYVPRGRAREYAALAINLFTGCSHGCVYCFVPGMPGRSTETHAHPKLRASSAQFIKELERALRRPEGHWGNAKQVHLCFTTDPYTEFENDENTREAEATRVNVIDALHRHGFSVAMLTKAGRRSLADLHRLGKSDAMAITITVLEEDDAARWEPHAAPPLERLEVLKQYHDASIPTWVSLEPVIDPRQSLTTIAHAHKFVDVFKVGRMNHCNSLPDDFRSEIRDIDWGQFGRHAIDRLEHIGYQRIYDPDDAVLGCADNKLYYIKEDLAKCLRRSIMIYRRMNRVPKGADTKLSTPCKTLHVNWSEFRDKKDNDDEED